MGSGLKLMEATAAVVLGMPNAQEQSLLIQIQPKCSSGCGAGKKHATND